jgi:hypothetical protein
MRSTWIVYNALPPTTSMMVKVATGTAIKTLLQGTAPSSRLLRIIEWGITADGSPDLQAELIHTTTVAGGTPTAVVPTLQFPAATGTAADNALSTWGFSPTSEGAIVATTKVHDTHYLKSSEYQKVWELGSEPVISASGVVRIRVLAVASVNALCWCRFAEN